MMHYAITKVFCNSASCLCRNCAISRYLHAHCSQLFIRISRGEWLFQCFVTQDSGQHERRNVDCSRPVETALRPLLGESVAPERVGAGGGPRREPKWLREERPGLKKIDLANFDWLFESSSAHWTVSDLTIKPPDAGEPIGFTLLTF
jgi:hypothetical protein